MTHLESARFGAWFDRLQSMVDQALSRVGHRPVLATVPDDLARLFGADAVLVVVSFAGSELVRIGRFVEDSVALDRSWPTADIAQVARELGAPGMLDRDTIATIFATSDAPQIESAVSARLRGHDSGGVVVVASTRPDFFDMQTLALVHVAADQFSRVFESEHLVEVERAARERAEFLGSLNDLLTTSLDVEEIMRFVTRAAVPRLGDWCTLLVPATRAGEDDRRDYWHVDPDRVALARELALRYPVRPNAGPSAVIASGEARLFARLTADDLDGATPELAEIARTLRLGSVMMLPLRSPRGVLGSLSLMREQDNAPYTNDDLDLAQDVADRLALGLHNALQYEDQLAIAAQLQQSLLPRRLPTIAGLDVASSYWAASRTAAVGGDVYDVFALDGDRWGVLIGDVSGKGTHAAALTALVRHTVRAATRASAQPSEVLGWLNDAFREQSDDAEQFCTALFGVLERDETDFRFVFALAGHPQPVLVDRETRARYVGEFGQAIGMFPELRVTESTVAIGSGDVLVLYTDGVTDVAGPTAVESEEWLQTVAESVDGVPARSASAIVRQLDDWLTRRHEPARDRDDIALLVLRRDEPIGQVRT